MRISDWSSDVCSSDLPHAPERYGLEPEQSVEVCRPEGERRYLARLIFPSGEHPAFERTGNVGPRTPLPLDMSPAEQERLLADNMAMKPLSEGRSEEHTSELQSLMRLSYAVFCLTKKKNTKRN